MDDDIDQLFRELLAQRKTLEDLLLSARRDPAANSRDARGKIVLALLSQSLDRIRLNRNAWLRLDPAEKQGHPEIAELLRENQNLILKILVLDKERDQAPSRQGPVPSRPAPAAQGSSFVSRMYRRNSAT